MRVRTLTGAAAGAIFAATLATSALADGGPCDAPTGPAHYPDRFDWNSGPYLLGDLGGARAKAGEAGVTLCSQYNFYVYDNVQGGLRRGADAQGQLFSWIDIDLGKLTRADLLNDTYLHAAVYAMQGRAITPRYLGSFSTVSFFEELSTNRIGSAWIERQFLDGKLSVRAGQLGIDDEFLTSSTAQAFLNATFGFPGWTATDLPGGGAAYPLQAPGARVRYAPTDAVTLMAGAYSGDPAGRRNPNPQLADRYGTTFNLNGGTFWIAEAAYSTAYPNSGFDHPGTYKIGAWFETGHAFLDQRLDSIGRSLADPASSGVPRRFNNDWGVYGVVDQTILPGDQDGVHKLASFMRVGGSPGDRNLIDLYVDGGFTFTGLVPWRPKDLIGIGAAYDRIGGSARQFDRDTRLFAAQAAVMGAGQPAGFAPAYAPVRDQEVMIEAIYTINVTSWMTVDFDAQHFFHPGGHVLAPDGPNIGRVVRDATVFGFNTQIKL